MTIGTAPGVARSGCVRSDLDSAGDRGCTNYYRDPKGPFTHFFSAVRCENLALETITRVDESWRAPLHSFTLNPAFPSRPVSAQTKHAIASEPATTTIGLGELRYPSRVPPSPLSATVPTVIGWRK